RTQAAHRRAADVHVEDPPAQIGRLDEAVVLVQRLGEANASWVLTVGALVDRHAPARVVLLGLVDERILGLEEVVTNGDRLCRYAAEDAAHEGGEKPVVTPSECMYL